MTYSLKKILLAVVIVLPIAGLVSPVLATEEAMAFSLPNFLQFSAPAPTGTTSTSTLAASTTVATTTASTTELTPEEFCRKLDEAVTKLEASYLERRQAIGVNIEEQNKKLQEERQKYDDQRAWLRLRQDYYLKTYFARLSQLAETDLQEKGIEQYKKDVVSALAERRTLTDLAVEEYRQDMDNLKSSKVTEMETRLISYEEKLSNEIQKAAETCGVGNTAKAENSLQNRLLKLRADREKIFKDVNEAGRAIVAERDRKVAEAETKYKKAVELAKENLVKFLTVE